MAKLQQLSLETLEQLDNGLGNAAFMALLKRAIHDCMDRPAETKVRKVTLQLDLTPVLEADLTCTEVKVQILAKCSVPDYATKVYSTGVRRSKDGPMLVFNPDSSDNVNQQTLTPEDDD